jgi:hypothetical protein
MDHPTGGMYLSDIVQALFVHIQWEYLRVYLKLTLISTGIKPYDVRIRTEYSISLYNKVYVLTFF